MHQLEDKIREELRRQGAAGGGEGEEEAMGAPADEAGIALVRRQFHNVCAHLQALGLPH